MMEKEKFIQISKKVLFWTAYTLLMIPNIVIAVNVILSWFYYFTDYQYWLDNFTLHEWEGYPDINTSFLLKEATIVSQKFLKNFIKIKLTII